jgi:hypothetical protein
MVYDVISQTLTISSNVCVGKLLDVQMRRQDVEQDRIGTCLLLNFILYFLFVSISSPLMLFYYLLECADITEQCVGREYFCLDDAHKYVAVKVLRETALRGYACSSYDY